MTFFFDAGLLEATGQAEKEHRGRKETTSSKMRLFSNQTAQKAQVLASGRNQMGEARERGKERYFHASLVTVDAQEENRLQSPPQV